MRTLGLDEKDIPAECKADANSTACADALAAKGGEAGGAAVAGALLGPEAAPIGAAVGKYVGGSLRSWGSSLVGGGAAPCDCQLGACNDDNNFDHDKFMILAGNCKDPKVRAVIEKIVADTMVPYRNTQSDLTKSLNDRLEICSLLAGYAQCAANNWTSAKTPQAPCPANASRSDDGSCKCDAGIEYDQAQWANGVPACVPEREAASEMSTGKRVALAAGLGLLGYVAFRLATKKPILPDLKSLASKAKKGRR